MFETLADFKGLWQVTRGVRHADGTEAQFEGVAEFQPDGTGLVYAERGTMRMQGHPPMTAERRYLWRAGEGRQIQILFEDGRAFHSVDPDTPQAEHWCDPDQYDVHYDFNAWPTWSCRWRVTGPRKNYVMDTVYKPAGRYEFSKNSQ